MMKPELQRIAIAGACGWYRLVLEEDKALPTRYGMAVGQLVPPSGSVCVPIPDYLNDLNAMHSAEQTLTREQRWKYISALASDHVSHVAFATAAQRAEAFLKTLGLWQHDS